MNCFKKQEACVRAERGEQREALGQDYFSSATRRDQDPGPKTVFTRNRMQAKKNFCVGRTPYMKKKKNLKDHIKIEFGNNNAIKWQNRAVCITDASDKLTY